MEIILLIAALVCAAACTASGVSAAWLRSSERALREQRRFEEALAGILSYGRADMCRRPGEEG